MTQLACVPAFEYSRCGVLGLLGGPVWQLHTTPETRVRQVNISARSQEIGILQASSLVLGVSWVRVVSAWDVRDAEELVNADQ